MFTARAYSPGSGSRFTAAAAPTAMTVTLGADSLRYLAVDALARAIDLPAEHLCQACVTGRYPTPCGQHLYQIALDNRGSKVDNSRTYEQLAAALATQ